MTKKEIFEISSFLHISNLSINVLSIKKNPKYKFVCQKYPNIFEYLFYILFMIKPLEKLMANQRYHNSALELLLGIF